MDVMCIYLKAHQQQKVKKTYPFQIKKMITVLKIRKLAQRISSVEDADRVIVIDEGKIVNFDTPKNLLKTSKIYKEINDSQKKGDN